MEEMRIYIANLGKYNEGELVGVKCYNKVVTEVANKI
nr:antirestriction protein ArdA [Sellimonas intestinalis]